MDIQDKTQIKAALRQSFGSIVYAINDISEELFTQARAEGKWSPGEILGHLILSTKPLNKALTMPKPLLQSTFGMNNRKERTFDEVRQKYYSRLEEGVKAPENMSYRGVAEKGKEAMINSFTDELGKLLVHVDTWSEKDLSDYVLPHPAIGKLTIREMLFFTHFHTEHHCRQMVPQTV